MLMMLLTFSEYFGAAFPILRLEPINNYNNNDNKNTFNNNNTIITIIINIFKIFTVIITIKSIIENKFITKQNQQQQPSGITTGLTVGIKL